MKIACEQAVYGSFPFWDKGYAVLARSAGCRDEWLADFTHLCQSLGQPPSEAAPRVDRLIMAKKLPSGPWLICQGSAQGCDDRGRPGAWAFHGLFLSGREYRRAGATPFAFRSVFLERFQPELQFESGPFEISYQDQPENFIFRDTLLHWLARGRQIRLLTDNPADLQLVESLWCHLPASARRKRSMTTWAFRPEVNFHLAAVSPGRWSADLPRKNRLIWAMAPDELTASNEISKVDRSFKHFLFSNKPAILLPIVGLALAMGVRSCVTCDRQAGETNIIHEISHDNKNSQLPLKSRFESHDEPANVKMAIQEQLADWSERLEIQPDAEPSRTLQSVRLISKSLRYQGPSVDFFSKSPESIGLDGVIARCAAVQPIPDETDTTEPESARYSLALLAWSVGASELQSKAEIIQSPADARRWFEQLRDFIVPENVNSWIRSPQPKLKGAEWTEARSHLNRLLKLRGD